jgi:hypothetical protein
MKKILYVNGCSHSCGAEMAYVGSCREPYDLYNSFGGIISRKYDLEYQNDAVSGGTIRMIHSTTVHSILKLLEKYDPSEIFVLIGWTGYDRTEVFYEDNMYVFIPGLAGTDTFKNWPMYVQEAFKHWIINIDYKTSIPNNFALTYLAMVNFLKSYGIDYYFFNTVTHLHRPEKNPLHITANCERTDKLFDMIENDTNFLEPYNKKMAYTHYFDGKYDPFEEGRCWHFREPAQQDWADLLISKFGDRLSGQ